MSALPSLRQLSYLVALAQHLNFTRAAAACFVTQSTLSSGLKELEATLGASLVERDRQSVLMTPLGLEVVERARALLAAAEDLAALAAASAEPMTGTLRLGAIPTLAPFLLPRILPGLRAKYPKLKLLLREDVSANLLQRLAGGQLDFVLLALPFDTGDMLVRKLFDDEFWLVGREDDPALKAKRATVTAPVAEKLVLLEEGPLPARAHARRLRAQRVVQHLRRGSDQLADTGADGRVGYRPRAGARDCAQQRPAQRHAAGGAAADAAGAQAHHRTAGAAFERETGGLDGAGRFHRGRAQARPLRRHHLQGAAARGVNDADASMLS